MLFASDAMMQNHPQEVRGFIRGWFDTIAWMKKNKAEAVRATQKDTHLPDPIASAIYDAEMPTFFDDGHFDRKKLAAVKQSLVELGLVPHPPPDDALITEAYLPYMSLSLRAQAKKPRPGRAGERDRLLLNGFSVIPAKAGSQGKRRALPGSGFRRGDDRVANSRDQTLSVEQVARRDVAGRDLVEARGLDAAAREGLGAAGVEGAAGGRIDRARHVALQQCACAAWRGSGTGTADSSASV